jgi:hypothetical protein
MKISEVLSPFHGLLFSFNDFFKRHKVEKKDKVLVEIVTKSILNPVEQWILFVNMNWIDVVFCKSDKKNDSFVIRSEDLDKGSEVYVQAMVLDELFDIGIFPSKTAVSLVSFDGFSSHISKNCVRQLKKFIMHEKRSLETLVMNQVELLKVNQKGVFDLTKDALKQFGTFSENVNVCLDKANQKLAELEKKMKNVSEKQANDILELKRQTEKIVKKELKSFMDFKVAQLEELNDKVGPQIRRFEKRADLIENRAVVELHRIKNKREKDIKKLKKKSKNIVNKLFSEKLPHLNRLEEISSKLEYKEKNIKGLEKKVSVLKAIISSDNPILCKICMDDQINCSVDCGHTFCGLCSNKLIRKGKCPYCNKSIKKSHPIYF